MSDEVDDEADASDASDAPAKPERPASSERSGKPEKKPAKKKRAASAPARHAETTDGASVRAVRVSRWYGKVTAISDVSLHLGPGIWGLLGPNGSGKTTFMRMVAGQIKPSTGKLTVCGEAPFGNPEVLRRIGYCPEADSLYDELTGLEFVSAMAELSGYPPAVAKKRAKDALEEFGLADAMDRAMGGYSRGMRQRAKLAQAIVHDPDVLLLDEPLTGTDPTSRQAILESLRRRATAGALVLFSTHVLPEIEALTDRVLLIARGQVVAQGEMQEIRELLDEHPHHIRVQCDRPRVLASALLASEEGVVALHFPAPDLLEVRTWQPDETYRAIAAQVVEKGLALRSMTSPDANLEALFHYLVERANRGAGTGADAGGGGHVKLESAAEKAAYQQQLAPGGGA
ncbi:MAG: ABC transporter ATP-binding protein [Sandaracinaceae bacterium]|nr:ABC transporter ATP-binding protein [Sandaracinaceae bacterium]